jgi:HD superfamily phosphohydrolase
MHSDLDCDRMDYLLRDAHYTGIQYGQFDRAYILANLATYDAGEGQIAFGVRENAAHAVEDFLIARFSWYSQVIKNPGSAKFDVMSTAVASALLDEDLIHQFHDLLEMIERRDERFFWWNDIYFMTRLQEVHYRKRIKDPRIAELIHMILYRQPPKTVRHPAFEHRILSDDTSGALSEKAKLTQKLKKVVAEMESVIEKHGTGREWILADVPEKDVLFTKGLKALASKKKAGSSLYRERDPVKLVTKSGAPKLLVERENSLMKHLSGFMNFVPSVYANDHAMKLLAKKGLLPHN